jgi:hypothetical protein
VTADATVRRTAAAFARVRAAGIQATPDVGSPATAVGPGTWARDPWWRLTAKGRARRDLVRPDLDRIGGTHGLLVLPYALRTHRAGLSSLHPPSRPGVLG